MKKGKKNQITYINWDLFSVQIDFFSFLTCQTLAAAEEYLNARICNVFVVNSISTPNSEIPSALKNHRRIHHDRCILPFCPFLLPASMDYEEGESSSLSTHLTTT